VVPPRARYHLQVSNSSRCHGYSCEPSNFAAVGLCVNMPCMTGID
jgi:hypothetical protein